MGANGKEHKRIVWSSVEPKEVSFLWPSRIPRGKLTVLSGDSSAGKTMLALDISTRLTTGREMPLSDAEPILGNVLFQSREDSLEDTLLARCISVGADRDRISSIEADGLNFDEDCDIIEQNIRETGALLGIFDPLQQYLSRSADMCRITDVRRILSNLGGVAARTNCAIVLISHQSKGNGQNELHRVYGSVDITAVARSVLRVSVSENDPDIRIIKHIKSSVSRPAAPIGFRIEDNASITYLGEYDGECDDEIYDELDKRSMAAEIMYSLLKDQPIEGKEVYRACKAAGIGSRTVESVKKELNVRSGRDEDNRRIWILPNGYNG